MPYQDYGGRSDLGVVFDRMAEVAQTVQQTRERGELMSQNREKFNTQQKIDKLELKKLEGEYDPELIEAKSQIAKKQANYMNAMYDLAEEQLNQQSTAAKGQMKDTQNVLKGIVVGGRRFNPMTGEMKEIGETEKFNGAVSNVRSVFSNPDATEEDKAKVLTQTKDAFPSKVAAIDNLAKSYQSETTKGLPIEQREIKKKGFLGIGGFNQATKDKITEVKTYQDLVDIYNTSKILESKGVKVEDVIDQYEEEYTELFRQGTLK